MSRTDCSDWETRGLTEDRWLSETSSTDGGSDTVRVHQIQAGLGSKVSFRLRGDQRKSWNTSSRIEERIGADNVMFSSASEREAAQSKQS